MTAWFEAHLWIYAFEYMALDLWAQILAQLDRLPVGVYRLCWTLD